MAEGGVVKRICEGIRIQAAGDESIANEMQLYA
jgi:hypothetical protein